MTTTSKLEQIKAKFYAAADALIPKKNLPQAVCIVCIHPDTGEVLAATRPGTTDQWGLIGGKVDAGETFIQAAYREFREETGVNITCELEYLTTMNDTHDYEVAVYQVPTVTARYVANHLHLEHKGRYYSVEPDIIVGYIPMLDVCKFGPFEAFNSRVLGILLAKAFG